MGKNKIYSRIDEVPYGMASEKITEGCMVLEGGAFRGNYTSGVMDALMENDINLSCTIGTSAGAMIGASYVAGHIGRSAKINLRFRHDKRYMGPSVIKKNKGIIGFDFILATYGGVDSTYPLNLARFFDPKKRFVAVATNVNTGKAKYFEKGKCEDIFKAIAASASMPMVSKPVFVEDDYYLDGGCADSIPFKWAIKENYEKIIVVKTRDDSYRKSDTEMEQKIKRGFYRNYPKMAESLVNRSTMYNKQCDELDKLREEGRVLVLSPSKPIEISRLEKDMEKLGEVYFLGYHDTLKRIDKIKQYLEIQ